MLSVLVWLSASACLEPLSDDRVPPRGLVLPAGTEVESIFDDPDLAMQVAENDGVDDVVPLLSGFAGGDPIKYWDFGEAPRFAAPIVVLYRGDLEGEWEFAAKVPGTTAPFSIIDSIPGDPGYTPFWSVFFFKVTSAYQGEVIPSFAAIEEAVELGLLEAEPLQVGAYANCPVLHRDVRLEVGLDDDGDDSDGGNDGLLAPIPTYYQGMVAAYYDFANVVGHGLRPLEGGVNVPMGHRFVLARPGQPALSEMRRRIDITGDGDTRDSNDIFRGPLADLGYTPLRESWIVTVPETYYSIDSSGDEADAAYTDFADVFSGSDPLVAIPENVVAFDNEGLSARNMPLQSKSGGL